MKKKLAALLLAAMTITAVAGCGKGGDSSGSSQGAASGDGGAKTEEEAPADNAAADEGAATGEVQDIALKVWCPQNQVDSGIMEQQQAAFAAEHPEYNITWTTEIVGEDKCQESVLKDVGAAADVFLFASDQLPSLVEAGAIARLGGATEEMVNSTIAEAVVATAKVDDALYAIPFTHNTFFMFYDKTILDEADVTSLEKIMAKETADNVYNFYFESAGGWKLGCYYYGAGLSIFGPDGSDVAAGVDWNSEKGVAVTNYLIDLINKDRKSVV